MNTLKDKLIRILLDGKIIGQQELNSALEIQKKEGGRISDILVREKFISHRDLISALSQNLGFPPLDINRVTLDPNVVSIVSKDVCRFYQVLPISRVFNLLTIAMADPLNIFALDDVKLMTGLEIAPVIVRQEDLLQVMNEYFTPKASIETILKEASPEEVVVTEEKTDEIDVSSLVQQSKDPPVVKLVNVFLVQAIRDKASDIHIEPFEKSTRVRFRVDGVLHDIPSPPRQMHNAIVSRIKILSHLDIAERRLPQDGRFRIRVEQKEIDFRVSILPSSHGEKIVMRLLDKSAVDMRLDSLGFDREALEYLKECIHRPNGMILITGPTGSGKTTTLYSAINEINKPELNIVTVEDPVEYLIYGVNQVQINPDIGLTFANGLRTILRQDPDVVLVGEIRDFETSDIAIKAALTGHLVFSTLHTNDAAGAITRLIDMGIEPFLVSSSILMSAAQRLVRRLCLKCREPAIFSEEVLKQAQLKLKEGEKVNFFKAKGCKDCNMSGYHGRMSLMEVMMIDSEINDMIVKKVDTSEIKRLAIKKGMKTLRQVGLAQVKKGLTSIEEVLRVTSPD